MFLHNPVYPHNAVRSPAVNLPEDTMDTHDLQLPYLSDEAAVAILDFLHAVILNFEAHYAGEIHRYYAQRSPYDITRPDPPEPSDPPF